jgi:hypothetical protein
MDHGAWACPMPAVADEVRGPGEQVRGHHDFCVPTWRRKPECGSIALASAIELCLGALARRAFWQPGAKCARATLPGQIIY